MGRVFGLLAFAAVAGLVSLPFVLTSRALDEHGVPIRGTVSEKREWAFARYSNWESRREVSIQYIVPETRGYAFLIAHPTVEAYDALRPNQPVDLRYLPRQYVPDVPGANVLWEIHALPTVRVTGFEEAGRLDRLRTPYVRFGLTVAAGVAALILLWKVTRARVFAWSAAAAGVVILFLILFSEFPRRTPEPAVDVRRATGVVTGISRIDSLFSGSRTRGVMTDQPVDVVTVRFVPAGRTEPVVAADLIDRASVPNLKERSTVTLSYEAASPRTAWIEGATRTFPERNLRGLIVAGAILAVFLVGVMLVVNWISRAFQRLVRRST